MNIICQSPMMNFFKIFANEHEKSRIAFVGEAGVGKKRHYLPKSRMIGQ